MSVESEILRIQHNIASAYAKVAEKGGEVPSQPTSAKLAAAVASIPAGGSSGEVYSTEETRIGTWIDGKPLYRKVYNGVTGASGEVKNIGVVLNLDNLINLFGVLKTSSENFIVLSFSQVSSYTTLGVRADTNMVYVLSNSPTHLNSTVTVIVEYTKTTDQATTLALSETAGQKNTTDFALDLSAQSTSFAPITVSSIPEEEG